MISESDTSSDSDSNTWKDTESEISTSSKTKQESCVSQVEQNEEPKRMFSSENTQKQNCEAAEKRNKRIDKKVKSSSIRSKAESDVCLKSSEQLCEEDLHEKNWPGTHDKIMKNIQRMRMEVQTVLIHRILTHYFEMKKVFPICL